MKIDALKFHKNNADVSAGGVEYKKLPLSEVARYNIKADTEMDDARFAEFLAESDKTAAKNYLFAMLSRGQKTEKEARIRLYQKGFRKESVASAIELAKQYKYICDGSFAESYVEQNRAGKGAYRIKSELKQKGVPDEVAEDATEGLAESEVSAARRIAARLAAGKDLGDQKNKEKIMRHLVMRGFSYETIKDALASLGADTSDFDI